MGFRARQIATLTFVAAVVALATSLVSAALLARYKSSDAMDSAELIGRALFHQASRVIRQNALADMRDALASDEGLRSYADAVVGYSPTTLYVAISDADGTVIFHSDPAREGEKLEHMRSLRELSERNPLGQLWELGWGQGGLVLDRQLSIEGDKPAGTVRVALSAVLLGKELWAAIRAYALIATTVVLVSFLISFYIANRLLAPLVALREQLRRIDIGENQPLDLQTEADVSRVADFFDALSSRLAADHRLDQSGLSLNALVTGLTDAVVVLAADRTILSLNETAWRLLDTETSVVGTKLDDLLPADHPLRVVVGAALESGRSETIQPVPLAGESEPVDYMLSAARLSESDRTSGVLVVARDLRRLSHLASQLSYAQKLASLGRLTSGVSHQLRNPLNAMTMHLEILRKKIAAGSPEAERHVAVLEEELGRLDRVVKGFLEFSRPEEIELHRLDVEEVVQVAVNRMQHLAERNNIALTFHPGPQIPPIIANFQLLEQAFVNLITNSCEAMPDGGKVDVSTSRTNGQVVLEFEDSGPGIPDHLRDKVFDLYVTTKEGGSGVGLSLVYRIVQLHGGDVRIDSTPGVGTRATITLKESSL